MRAKPPSKIPLGVAVLAFLMGCTNRQLGDPRWTEGAVAWGEPVDGLKVGLARREYEAGAAPGVGQVYLGLHLLNVSGREMKLLWPLKPKFGQPVMPLKGDESVAVVFEYGSSAGQKTARFPPPNRPLTYTLRPGEERSMEVRLGPGEFAMERFAAGRVVGVYENRQGVIDYGDAAEGPVSGLWTGRAVSGAVEVEGSRIAATQPAR
jgi:hypothetical protein